MDVIPNTYVYIRVPVQDKLVYQAKLKFYPEPGFKFKSKNQRITAKDAKMTRVDLAVYYSQTFKEPTKEKYDRKQDPAQGVMSITSRSGGERFDVNYVYFGFYSVMGCTLKVEAEF